MHYTSIENIHKVIDPLFLDDLRAELENAQNYKQEKARQTHLAAFRDKLASLKFLDPACGSGNFLTDSYLCLRILENEAVRVMAHDQIAWEAARPIKVSINQFYGIEINDFAATVAQTAMWIAEGQMLQETEAILSMDIDYLPLTTAANIVEGNALRMDWNDVVSASELSYTMGNPPFVGKKQSPDQKRDMELVFGSKSRGKANLDYVTAWYRKAVETMVDTPVPCAFVSTNSIVQGEHIPFFWAPMYDAFPIKIVFAHTSFPWESEVSRTASVYCVIVGFTMNRLFSGNKYIFIGNERQLASNIHPYLIESELIFVSNRRKPLQDAKPLIYGSFALDNGNYTISEDEYREIISKEPNIAEYLPLFLGSEEFIRGKKRHCIWLKNADPGDIQKSSILKQKIKNVQE